MTDARPAPDADRLARFRGDLGRAQAATWVSQFVKPEPFPTLRVGVPTGLRATAPVKKGGVVAAPGWEVFGPGTADRDDAVGQYQLPGTGRGSRSSPATRSRLNTPGTDAQADAAAAAVNEAIAEGRYEDVARILSYFDLGLPPAVTRIARPASSLWGSSCTLARDTCTNPRLDLQSGTEACRTEAVSGSYVGCSTSYADALDAARCLLYDNADLIEWVVCQVFGASGDCMVDIARLRA